VGLNPLQRGDVLKVVIPGEYGKPRPAVIIQTRMLHDIPSIIVVPCTSKLLDDCIYRPDIPQNEDTGLLLPSQAMADKIVAVSKRRVCEVIGRVNAETLEKLEQAVQFAVGFMD
jgi:mRNA interferase MazF